MNTVPPTILWKSAFYEDLIVMDKSFRVIFFAHESLQMARNVHFMPAHLYISQIRKPCTSSFDRAWLGFWLQVECLYV